MQNALYGFLQLHATESEELINESLQKLSSSSLAKSFKELKTLHAFIMSNFCAPFNLKILDLFKKGNTWDDWIRIENQCQFTVTKHQRTYQISFPGCAAPAPVARFLNTACYLSNKYKLQNHCYQSTRQLQFDLFSFHQWHQDTIIYQHPRETDAIILMDSSKSVWVTRLKMLGCSKTIQSLYNNKYACTGGTQMVSNQNEKWHNELKMWISYVQNLTPSTLFLYLLFCILRHNFLCLKRMIEHKEKFPSVPDWYLDALSTRFDEIFMFKNVFDKAHKYGFQSFIIRPFEKHNFKYFYEAGVVKRPTWNHTHTRKLLNFLLSDLKIIENSDLELTEDIINRCHKDVFDEVFEMEMITNKLKLYLLKYIYFSLLLSFCVQQQYLCKQIYTYSVVHREVILA